MSGQRTSPTAPASVGPLNKIFSGSLQTSSAKGGWTDWPVDNVAGACPDQGNAG